ncbi:MAG TPA: hypothetical protein VFI31_09265 [Pirellulales bacterium]|nr:hypothetical protein [Pirellulales bacterium]
MTSLALTAVASLHLLAVYVATMGPLVCLWLQLRSRADGLAANVNQQLLKMASAALIIAAALGGLAVLLIGQLFPDAYLAAARLLPSSRYWPYGAVELVFSLVCFVMAAALAGEATASRLYFGARWFATLLGSTNLAYHFPTLFVMLGVLSARPEKWGQRLKFTTLLADPEIQSRVVHHLLAALVVTGAVIAWYGLRHGGDAVRAVAWGAKISTAGLLCQLGTGLWVVMTMPAASRQMLFGDDLLAAGLFAGSLLATFFVLPGLAAAALGQTDAPATKRSIVLALVIVVLMTATRHRTRAVLMSNRERHEATAAGDAPVFLHHRHT